MVKYKDSFVVFEEIPDRISLAVNITNCPHRCVGCHSPELRENIGDELTFDEIDKLIKENDGVNCFAFMGEGKDENGIVELSKYIRDKWKMETAIYCGSKEVSDAIYENFDFVKVGGYKAEYGPLNNPNTNQIMYKVSIIDDNGERKIHKENITYKFWKRE